MTWTELRVDSAFHLLHGADAPHPPVSPPSTGLLPLPPHMLSSAGHLLVLSSSSFWVLSPLLDFLASSHPPLYVFPPLSIPWLWDVRMKPGAPRLPHHLLAPASGLLGRAGPCPSWSSPLREASPPFLSQLAFTESLPQSPVPLRPSVPRTFLWRFWKGRPLPGLSSPPRLSRPPVVLGWPNRPTPPRHAVLLSEAPVRVEQRAVGRVPRGCVSEAAFLLAALETMPSVQSLSATQTPSLSLLPRRTGFSPSPCD